MDNVLVNVSTFLVDTLFTLYIFAVVLRFLLAWAKASFYNPVSQFLVTVTNPPLVPIRRLIPSLGSVDSASIVLAVGLKVIQLWLLASIAGAHYGIAALVVVAILQLLELVIYIYIFSIIIQALLSWVSPGTQHYGNPMASLLYSLNEPLLRPARRVIPQMGGLDLSPLVVIIVLNVILIVLKSLSQ